MTLTNEEKAKIAQVIEKEKASYAREELHSMVTLTMDHRLDEYVERLRVPGGWIYYRNVQGKFTGTFVPSPY
jgi:hypothetical protein